MLTDKKIQAINLAKQKRIAAIDKHGRKFFNKATKIYLNDLGSAGVTEGDMIEFSTGTKPCCESVKLQTISYAERVRCSDGDSFDVKSSRWCKMCGALWYGNSFEKPKMVIK